MDWSASAVERDAVPIERDRLLHAWRCQDGPGIPFADIEHVFMALGAGQSGTTARDVTGSSPDMNATSKDSVPRGLCIRTQRREGLAAAG